MANASAVNLSFDPSLFTAQDTHLPEQPLSSGIDLALRNKLFAMDMDYGLQVNLRRDWRATTGVAQQKLGASIRSQWLNRTIKANAALQTRSHYSPETGSYQHAVTPSLSRRISKRTLVDLKYQLLRNRPSKEAIEQLRRGYSFGLRGALANGKLHWSGTYNSAEQFREEGLRLSASEGFFLRSNYELIPQVKLELSSGYLQRTLFRGKRIVEQAEAQYGAGLNWRPSQSYALNLRVQQTDYTHNGEALLLRSGGITWFGSKDATVSLNYSDQLVEGAPGILLNTRLPLASF